MSRSRRAARWVLPARLILGSRESVRRQPPACDVADDVSAG